jgi:hypothetical protein
MWLSPNSRITTRVGQPIATRRIGRFTACPPS